LERDWTDRPETLPRSFGEVVGVSDGFIASDPFGDPCPTQYGCSTMWHSSDGLTWTKLGISDRGDRVPQLFPWKGGALMTDGASLFDLWTSGGSSELPLADGVPTPAPIIGSWSGLIVVGTGPLGLVSMRVDRAEVLLTRDGVDWKIQPAPSVPAGFPSIAVGDSSILYLGWVSNVQGADFLTCASQGLGEPGCLPHLWVGSVNP
jgi:hypothetical protein